MERVKVFLVDDHLIVRDGIKSLLESEGSIDVVGEASSFEELQLKIHRSGPDILLLDISLPDVSGIEICAIISKNFPDIKVIMLSMYSGEEFIYKALGAGAKGFLPKNTTKKELINAVKEVKAGGEYFSEQLTDVVFKGFIKKARGEGANNEDEKKLTPRELEVLRLYAEGYSNREIADKLFISSRTVESHKNHIIRKLELKSPVDLVKFAIKNKYIEL